jgi:hypothetical protein
MVRDRAKPSMMISAKLQFFLQTWLIKYKIWSTYLSSPLLFVRGDAHAKSSRCCMEYRLRVPCFLYAVMRVLKVIEIIWSIDREPLVDFYALVH